MSNIYIASQTDLAPGFNTATTYSTGELISKEGKFYVAKEDNVVGEFNPAKWTEIPLSAYAQTQLVPAYDASTTYSVGDITCINNYYYQCKVAITVAEPFDDTKWTELGNTLKDALTYKYIKEIQGGTSQYPTYTITFGSNPGASGDLSVSEGHSIATNADAHAEGWGTTVAGYCAHGEGGSNLVGSSASYAHAEGNGSTVTGSYGHVEGLQNFAMNSGGHAEGNATTAVGPFSHVEGQYTSANNVAAHAEGYYTRALGQGSHAEGYQTTANGSYSHAEGYYTTAVGNNSHTEGQNTFVEGVAGHAEGSGARVQGSSYEGAHAEGYYTTASAHAAHAEGWYTLVTGREGHAEGYQTTVVGNEAGHAEGYQAYASAMGAHAEGYGTKAVGEGAHAEGYYTTASQNSGHAEGQGTITTAAYGHAEGYYTTVSGQGGHAEGNSALASGDYAHAEGLYTEAGGDYQHVSGKYNIVDAASSYACIVGNGTASTARSNAYTLDWSGNATFAGDVTANGVSLGNLSTMVGYISTVLDSINREVV